MFRYNDSVKWYISDSMLTAELPLFTEVYAVYTAEEENVQTYDTIEELFQNDFRYQRVSAYTVERPRVENIVLTCKPVLGSPVIQSFALVTNYNNSDYLIAKVTIDPDSPANLPNSYDRIFTLDLPYRTVGDIKFYPNISVRLRKTSSSPIGDELVSVGEHHHSVDWGSGKDPVPTLSTSLGRYVASSDYNKQQSYNGTSYSLLESGTLNSTYSSVTGKLVSSGGDLSSIASIVDRSITSQIQTLLANVMEEYLMATNSIQILGHAIPDNVGYSDLAENDKYLLYVDKTTASDDRNLKAITSSDFRKWLVQKYSYNTVSSCTTNACVTIISSTANVTVVLNKTSQVAIVSNVNVVSSDINTSITVSYGSGGSISLYPRETAIILKDSDGTYSGFKIGATDLVRSVLSGTYGFSKVSFSNTAGSATTLADSFTVVDGKVNSVIKGAIEVSGDMGVTGNLAVSGNSSLAGTLGVTGASTLTGGVNSGLVVNSGNVSLTNGNLSVSGTSSFGDTITSSGNITASGKTITAGTITTTTLNGVSNLSATYITCTKITSSSGFYLS